jgi:hypothetical protein
MRLKSRAKNRTDPIDCNASRETCAMSIGTIILIILIIALLGGFSGIGGGPFYGTGYYGGGGLGLVIIVLLILVLMGRL